MLQNELVSFAVCLYVRSLLMNPLTDLPQILIRELGRTTGVFLVWFKNSDMSKLTFLDKVKFPGKVGFPRK